MRRIAIAGITGVVALGAMAPVALATSSADRAAASRASAWLGRQPSGAMPAGQQADIITSLRITGATPASLRPALAALAPRAAAYATTDGARAKVAIAQAAAGRSGALAGHDYLAEIQQSGADGRYGTTAFDQALSMIALRVAGKPAPAPAVATLRAARSGDGWAFSLSPTDAADPDSTSMAIIALRAARVPASDPAIRAGLAWLGAHRTGSGWAAMTGNQPSADSTALVARARVAAGTAAGSALGFVRRLQERSGAVANTRTVPESRLLATVASVPPLAGISLANGFRAG